MKTFQTSDIRRLELADNARLRYMRLQPKKRARGTVVLLQGRAEFLEKYDEVFGELLSRGFAILAPDLRGQGLSGRLIDNSDKGHISDFAVYVRDLKDVLRANQDMLTGPLIGLGHSMGGHILIRHLCEGGNDFDAVITVAPMIGLDVPAVPDQVLRAFVEGAHLLGRDEDYMPGAASYDPLNRSFEGNKLTSDEKRFDAARDLMRDNPDLALGGATIGWLKAALRSCALVMNPSLLARVETPLLIASARADMVVDPHAHDALVEICPAASLLLIEDAKHEILFEHDAMRDQFWQAFDDFVDTVLSAGEAG